jgi:uncharacterized protein YcfL
MERALLFALALVLALPVSARNRDTEEAAIDAHVYLSSSAALRANVLDVQEEFLPDGTLRIHLLGAAKTSRDTKLRYRVLWFNESGIPIKTVMSTWKPITLRGRRPFDITGISPSPAATDYRIEIEPQP